MTLEYDGWDNWIMKTGRGVKYKLTWGPEETFEAPTYEECMKKIGWYIRHHDNARPLWGFRKIE